MSALHSIADIKLILNQRAANDPKLTSAMVQRPLVAESGSQNPAFPAFLTSALPPEADIRMVES